MSFELPPIKTAADIVGATNAIAAAVASGALTTGEAANMSTLVSNVGRNVELEIEKRVAALEGLQPTGDQ